MATNAERLAVVEQKVTDIDKKLDAVLEKLDKLDERYPTRREFKAANWVVGTILSLLAVVMATLDHLKK